MSFGVVTGVLGTEPAATDAGTQAHPVGGGKTKTGKSGTIDKGFDQERADAVTRLPIISQARQNHTQYLGGKVSAANFLAYQKAGKADDFLQMPKASIRGPADPLVAGAEAECCRSKSQRAQPAMFAANEIAHLGADQRGIAARMLLYDQVIPQTVQWIISSGDQVQMQSLHLIYPARNVRHGRQRLTRCAKVVRWCRGGFWIPEVGVVSRS